MAEPRSRWQFFGRQDELNWLIRHCAWDEDRDPYRPDRRPFLFLRGERAVGKTELLRHAQLEWGERTPIIYLNAHPMDEVPHFHGRLKRKLETQSLQHLLEEPDEDDGLLLAHEKWTGEAAHLSWGLERLVRRGVTIMLDDIHRLLKKRWMDQTLRFLAHRLDPHTGPGTLVLCGLDLQSRLPFLQLDRVPSLTLRPLSPSAIMTMARHMDVLERPEEVLTAWSFMGGMATLWRYSFDHPEGSFWERPAARGSETVTPQDRVTLDWALRQRRDNHALGHINVNNHVKSALGEDVWDICLLLARLAQKPVPDRQLDRRERQLVRRLHDSDNGQFVARRRRLNGYRGRAGQRGVWDIASIPTLWQLRLYRNHTDHPGLSPSLEGCVRRQLPILIRHETDCLARMVADWLGEQKEAGWHVHQACAPGARGTPIDAMARFGPKGQRQLIVAQCRRRARELEPQVLRRQVELFQAAHRRRDERRNWPVHMLFVAPSISPHDRTRIAMGGGEPLALDAMGTRTWRPIPCQ